MNGTRRMHYATEGGEISEMLRSIPCGYHPNHSSLRAFRVSCFEQYVTCPACVNFINVLSRYA